MSTEGSNETHPFVGIALNKLLNDMVSIGVLHASKNVRFQFSNDDSQLFR